MAERTTHLSMPFILPSQAQKHVTHNEALQTLDTVVHLTVAGYAAAPPREPSEGICMIVIAPATDAWTGHETQLATWQDGAWQFLRPRPGWIGWFSGEQGLKVFRDDEWHALMSSDAALSTLGVNATADTVNRLVVASDASLFNHAGQGHQMKLNKAASENTATLLMQSNWTGHAEIGLAGDNDFSIKVSDGAQWKTGLKISQNGAVSMPSRPAVRAHNISGASSPATNSYSGFSILDPVQGNVSLGSTLSDGRRSIVVPASGLYLLSLMVTAVASTAHSVSLMRNVTDTLFSLRAPNAVPLSLSHAQLTTLVAGDELSLLHAGTAQIQQGRGITELTLLMV